MKYLLLFGESCQRAFSPRNLVRGVVWAVIVVLLAVALGFEVTWKLFVLLAVSGLLNTLLYGDP